MPTNDNQVIHVRTTTKAEVEQKIIDVGLDHRYLAVRSLSIEGLSLSKNVR